MKRIIFAVGALVVFGLLSGCATTRGYTTLAVPAPAAVVTPNSAKMVVIDSVRDARDFQADPRDPSIPSLKSGEQYKLDASHRGIAIGRKRNTWGRAMGDWVLENGQTVESLTRDLISSTLRGLGYTIGNASTATPGSEHVSVEINQFWAWFTPGIWTATIEAKVGTHLEFTGASGRKAVDVTGYGRNQIQTGREANWQLAYDRAFKDYENNLRQAMSGGI